MRGDAWGESKILRFSFLRCLYSWQKMEMTHLLLLEILLTKESWKSFGQTEKGRKIGKKASTTIQNFLFGFDSLDLLHYAFSKLEHTSDDQAVFLSLMSICMLEDNSVMNSGYTTDCRNLKFQRLSAWQN